MDLGSRWPMSMVLDWQCNGNDVPLWGIGGLFRNTDLPPGLQEKDGAQERMETESPPLP